MGPSAVSAAGFLAAAVFSAAGFFAAGFLAVVFLAAAVFLAAGLGASVSAFSGRKLARQVLSMSSS